MNKQNFYQLVIIGGGPAGLTAGIYAARSRVNVLLIEKNLFGGNIINTEIIENYPGFPEGIKSIELAERFKKQSEKFGLHSTIEEVIDISAANYKNQESVNKKLPLWQITTNKNFYLAPTVIICCGRIPQKLEVKGEDEFIGRGVSYCAICDAPFFQGKTVAVIGGGDSALEEALYLIKFAKKVIIIHRRDKFRATQILQEKVFSNPQIEVIFNSTVSEISGTNKVEKITLKNTKNEKEQDIFLDGIFVFIGLIPSTKFLKNLDILDKNGYIITDANMSTTKPGIFSAGDCRAKSLFQIVTACGDGAVAEFSAQQYLNK